MIYCYLEILTLGIVVKSEGTEIKQLARLRMHSVVETDAISPHVTQIGTLRCCHRVGRVHFFQEKLLTKTIVPRRIGSTTTTS